MRKKSMAWILWGIIAIALTGCAESPKQSVVREKNMEKMLEEAESSQEADSYEQVKEEVKKYKSYKTRIKDKNLKVTVDVDAKVEIPEVEKLSVYRVSAKKINQKFLDRTRKTLTQDVAYYDGKQQEVRTKSFIAKEIRNQEKTLAREKKSKDKEMVEEDERVLARLQEEYKKAPERVDLTDYPLDLKIQKIKKVHDSNPGDTFYDWLYELHGNGEFFYGLSDGKDGNYHSLFMQNSGNYGNCLRYEYSKTGYCDNIYHADVESDIPMIVPKEDGKNPDFFIDLSKPGVETGEQEASVKCVDNEPLTISQEEAETKVTRLLGQLGLDDYQCYEKGIYSQMLEAGEDGEIKYRDVYRFLCLRKLDGIFVNNLAGYKLTDDWQGSEYVKKMWESEVIAVAVNDSGIVDFYYLSPLSIDETVVEKSRIKSFSEVRDTFEQMVVIENAPETLDDTHDANVSVKVTEVRLVYTRISEKDSFDTGLVVPVWNFEGTIVDEYGAEKAGNVLSINAIDGSVIDYQLGY